jgi:hypothetical protein
MSCDLLAARDAGVGYAVMTNSETSGPLKREVELRLANIYAWPGYTAK